MARLDLLVFGATGFTGKYTVVKVVELAEEMGNLSWGIAGRNMEKLQAVLSFASQKSGKDLSAVPTFIADVNDEDSLFKMSAQTKVVINCCGPYRFFGEPVVKACIANSTHHVDISGEPEYMERIQLEYHEDAAKKGIYIVSACGFDSIPAELGVLHFQQQFKGEVNSIESYLSSEAEGARKGAAIHYGTWESAIYGLTHADELRPLRAKLYPKRLPSFSPKLKPRSVIHKSEFTNRWSLPFPGSDRSVVMRSQRYFFEHDMQRPVQIQTYMSFQSLLVTVAVAFVAAVFGLMTKTSFTRNLLLKNPRFFSLGFVSREGPIEEEMENVTFSLLFSGEGWTERTNTAEEEHTTPPNKTMLTKVSGRNPGYGFTCTALVLSAITVLKDADKMPGNGGVFSPGAAFAKTSLMEDLSKHGFKLEVISTNVKK